MSRPVYDRESPQPLVGFLDNDEWYALLTRVDALVAALDGLPAGETRTQVFELLGGIDSIHREALRRLVRLFKQGVLEQVVTDPTIHTLMELYDLLPDEDGAPGAHRHSFPVRVEQGPSGPQPRPRWIPVAAASLEQVPLIGALADDREIVLCRVDDEVYALAAHCLGGGALEAGTLSRFTLACPHHTGCFYDVRQGSRLGTSETLECYPVRRDEQGRVLVGLDMAFRPNLPSF